MWLLIALIGLLPMKESLGQEFFVNTAYKRERLYTPVRVYTSGIMPEVGVRASYTDLFQLQLATAFSPVTHVTASVVLRPYQNERFIEPYVFLGFGRYFGDAESRYSAVPAGIGASMAMGRYLRLNAELVTQWSLRKNHQESPLDFAVMPKIGISTWVGRFFGREKEENLTSPEPSLPPVVAEASTADSLESEVTEESARSVTEDMVYIHDGMFIMGLTDEDPLMLQVAGLKRVTLSAYYIDKYEVSNEAYRAFLEGLDAEERARMLPDSTVWQSLGNRYGWTDYFWGAQYSKYPVVGVTWEQAKAFCESQGKRLPTEAEWEYAARGGKIGLVYPWEGLEPRDKQGRYLANYKPGPGAYAADGFAFTAPVFAFPQNEWGLHNIAGNVAEWTMDAYTPTYSVLSDFNPVYEDENEPRRVVRGGSWASDAFYIGVGVRDAMPYNTASPYVGIRCAMDADDPGHDVQALMPVSEDKK